MPGTFFEQPDDYRKDKKTGRSRNCTIMSDYFNTLVNPDTKEQPI